MNVSSYASIRRSTDHDLVSRVLISIQNHYEHNPPGTWAWIALEAMIRKATCFPPPALAAACSAQDETAVRERPP